MKKIITSILVGLMTLTMVFGMTACGGPSDEQTEKIESLLTKYETVVSDCEKEFKKYPTVEDDDYKQLMSGFSSTIDQIKQSAIDLRETYDENKDSYTPEDADSVIEALEEQVKQGENLLEQIKTNVKEVEDTLKQMG